MRLSCRVCLQLFDAAEYVGISRATLVDGIPGDPKRFEDAQSQVTWDELVSMFENLSRACNGEPERLREVGRSLVHAPSWNAMRALTRAVLPLRVIYRVGTEWVAPAQFPHLRLEQRFESEHEIVLVGEVPEPYTPCVPFFYFFEGVLQEIPRLLGLPRAIVLESEILTRKVRFRLLLPGALPLPERIALRLRALLRPEDLVAAFEQQRRELTDGLVAAQAASLEVRRIFDGLPDLVVIHRDGVILWTNAMCQSSLGYDSPRELVGRPLLELVPAEFHDLVKSRMASPVDGPPSELVEVPLLTKSGDLIQVEVAPSRQVVYGGAPARLVVGRDVTERARMQRSLALADRMASIGLLAAGVAHEINNPLAYVLNNVEVAHRDLAALGEPARRSREALGVALEGVARIREIVGQLVSLSRTDAPSIGLVDVSEVVRSTVALASRDIEKRARIVCEIEPVPPVLGSSSRLGQVVLNLLVNASQAMPEAKRAENELRVAVRRTSRGGALVEVSDNGVGIPREHASRIFEPFFTTKGQGEGTGLGLAISQMLVHEAGGEISFLPRAPQGSTFLVELPPLPA
jgi:PAS domain S-box-containing protein